jgi:2-dehydro-3-deoxygluconokinase
MARLVAIGECMVEMAAAGNGLFRQGFAGDTFNAAWHARRQLGGDWSVDYVTALGDDSMSAKMLAFMEDERIGTSHVRRIKGRCPGLYLIELKNGERQFNYWRDTSAARALADDPKALEAAVAGADAVFFSGITLAILAPAARQVFLEVIAASRVPLIAFDSNIRMRLWPAAEQARAAIQAASRLATLALPTLADEVALFGDEGLDQVASRYRNAGTAEVVVKNGSDPALVAWPQGRLLIGPEAAVSPVDTTGAGDSFNGAYLAARLSGRSPAEAARLAHATATRVIMAYGALV